MNRYSVVQKEIDKVSRDEVASLTPSQYERLYRDNYGEGHVVTKESQSLIDHANKIATQLARDIADSQLKVDDLDGLYARPNKWGDIEIRLRRRRPVTNG
jgi:hypothetical protein